VQVVQEVIEAAHAIGLYVRACVSDMGSGNRDMWKHIGVYSNREKGVKNFIEHPCVDTGYLYFLADAPHLLKNIRNCLLTQNITLPE
jgi:hypothetical protein